MMRLIVLIFLLLIGCGIEVEPDWFSLIYTVKDASGDEVYAHSLSISHDDSKIAIARYYPGGGTSTLSIFTADTTEFYDTALAVKNVAWSHDDSLIYYDNGANIYTVNPDGTNPALFSIPLSGDKTLPRPSPDGKYLAFLNDNKICLYNLSTTIISTLFSGSMINRISWSADSSILVFDCVYDVYERYSWVEYYHLYLITNIESASPVVKSIYATKDIEYENLEPTFLSDGRIIHTNGIYNAQTETNIDLLPNINIHYAEVIEEATLKRLFYITKDLSYSTWYNTIHFVYLPSLDKPLYISRD